ncbi:DUF2059 domain-containing protein [Hyphococcus sp.]|uniref:DUF2059 domain-containing protein n=1 Tax=Hyphococcus sp. TaxID=2038636 RepID=UPI0035C6A729
MTVRTTLFAVIAVAGLCAPAMAADDEAAKLKLAEELIELSQAKQMSKQIVAQMAPMQMQVIRATRPDTTLTDEELETVLDKTSEIMIEEMAPAIDALIDKMAPVYAEVYTLEELQGVVAFYNSPVGASFLSKQSNLVDASMAVSAQWAQETMPGVMARAQPRIKEMVEKYKAQQ